MSGGRQTRTLMGMHGNALVADTWWHLSGEPGGDLGAHSRIPSVIFLHGGGQTRHAWSGTARKMAGAGWFAMSLDLRGHGDSAWTKTYDRHHFGGDIVEVVRALRAEGVAPPVLVGASLGGISSVFAEDMTEEPLARALVLVDIAPDVEPAGIARIVDFMASGKDGFATVEDAADTVAAYLRERARPKDVSGLKKNLRLRDDGRLYWHWDPAFLGNIQADADRQRDFKMMKEAALRLSVPVLLVRGSQSDVLTDDGVQAFKELVPDAKFADIAGAGHMVAGDKNDAFTDAILSFAADLEGGAT